MGDWKLCPRCRETKPENKTFFRWREERNTFRSWCIQCENESSQENYWKSRAKRLRTMKRYQKAHPEVYIRNNRTYRRRLQHVQVAIS